MEISRKESVVVKKEKYPYRKYLTMYLLITFGTFWGMCLLYGLFYEKMVEIFGEVKILSPIMFVIFNIPILAGVFMYHLYDKKNGLKKFFRTLIPRKQDLKWFPILVSVMILYLIAVRSICILLGIPVPEITDSPSQIILKFLKNIYEENGMFGLAFGWYGFVLFYLQGRFKNNIKAGLLAGAIVSIYVIPGCEIRSTEEAVSFALYIVQLMILGVCVSYILNDTRGNIIFFVLPFWISATGSKVNLYYFVSSTQIVQIFIYIGFTLILHFTLKKKYANKPIEEKLVMFPNYIEEI